MKKFIFLFLLFMRIGREAFFRGLPWPGLYLPLDR